MAQFEQTEENPGLQEFKKRYQQLVTEEMAKLPTRQEAKRQAIFDVNARKGFNPDTANAEWREALYDDVNQLLKNMSKNMALELQSESTRIIAELQRLLWNSE